MNNDWTPQTGMLAAISQEARFRYPQEFSNAQIIVNETVPGNKESA